MKKNKLTIVQQLSLYKLRSKIEITNLSNEFVVANKLQKIIFGKLKDKQGHTVKFREDTLILDPRSKLGARLIINLEKLYLSIKN